MSHVKISAPWVRFHRNGSAGASFFTVSFKWGRGTNAKQLRAVVFDEPGAIAVTELDKPWERFDGCYFETAVREAIAEQEKLSGTFDRTV